MSFKCQCGCNQVVIGEKRVMVPVVKRMVNYNLVTKTKAPRYKEPMENVKITHGWEISQEVPVAESHVDTFYPTEKFEKATKENTTVKYKARPKFNE